MEDKKLPTGRFGRLANLASMGLKAGASLLKSDAGKSAAEQAADMLGNMRGIAAKVGQMASYVDGVVPDEQKDAFELALKKLRSMANTSDFTGIRAAVESELQKPLDQLYRVFDPVPIASASIGQVHRAELLDGTEVAVKVQHPGIEQAVESDLSNAGLLERMVATAAGSRFQTKEWLNVIRARFREELDYGLEAERQIAFATLHEGDLHIGVPKVYQSHSAKRVLTSEFVRGLDFDDAMVASVEDRKLWAEALWRFVFKGNLVGGMFNADPHPGNYVFQPNGRVTFLDYGCVQVIPPPNKVRARQVHKRALAKDRAGFHQASMDLMSMRPGPLAQKALAYMDLNYRPLFETPFRVTKPYASLMVERMTEMAKMARTIDEDQFFTMPPDMFFINRLQFGFYSVLARLDVEADYRGCELAFLPIEGE
jgi:predicted unusual protein kinase regulating ubiquinone biosynthesis (AarF/ABC1/UbiB family)